MLSKHSLIPSISQCSFLKSVYSILGNYNSISVVLPRINEKLNIPVLVDKNTHSSGKSISKLIVFAFNTLYLCKSKKKTR